MKQLTEEYIKSLINSRNELHTHIIDISQEMNGPSSLDICSTIEIQSDQICLEWEETESCGCCYEGRHLIIPLHYLWENNWKKQYIAAKLEAVIAAKRKEEEKEEKAKKNELDRRKKYYLQLKEEFENEKD